MDKFHFSHPSTNDSLCRLTRGTKRYRNGLLKFILKGKMSLSWVADKVLIATDNTFSPVPLTLPTRVLLRVALCLQPGSECCLLSKQQMWPKAQSTEDIIKPNSALVLPRDTAALGLLPNSGKDVLSCYSLMYRVPSVACCKMESTRRQASSILPINALSHL